MGEIWQTSDRRFLACAHQDGKKSLFFRWATFMPILMSAIS